MILSQGNQIVNHQDTKWNSKYMEEMYFVSTTNISFHFTQYTGHISSEVMKRAEFKYWGGSYALIHYPFDEGVKLRGAINKVKRKKPALNKVKTVIDFGKPQLGWYFQGDGKWIASKSSPVTQKLENV